MTKPYDIVKDSIENQIENIKEQELKIKEQQDLIQEQMKNLIFFKKGRRT
jgi:hypothetical protein|tara:strand:- start:96 stop:245 length:150 start_codon:yes stop_codon:yes gene_type:complete